MAPEVPRFTGIEQVLIPLQRELAVDGKPYRFIVVVARHEHGEFHTLTAAWTGGDVLLVLLCCQQLFEDVAQLVLTEDALGLDIGQHLLQVPHTAGDRLHFTEPFVHLLQTLAYLLERFAQSLFQGGLQLLIDRLAHLVQALAIVLTHFGELLLNRAPHILDRVDALLALLVQLLDQISKSVPHGVGLSSTLFFHLLAKRSKSFCQFLALGLRLLCPLFAVLAKLFAQSRFQSIQSFGDFGLITSSLISRTGQNKQACSRRKQGSEYRKDESR